ncbi:MAG: hypothetical protein QM754_19690 [Tepidisphaeraceae bacterium]
MDDEEITWTQVLVTAVCGAVLGAVLGSLACIASPLVREWLPWSIVIPIGVGAVFFLWSRYAPWWLSFAEIMFWR